MSSLETSPTRRSRSVLDAVSTAFFAAASQESVLVPITSVTRYTLSAIPISLPPTRAQRTPPLRTSPLLLLSIGMSGAVGVVACFPGSSGCLRRARRSDVLERSKVRGTEDLAPGPGGGHVDRGRDPDGTGGGDRRV